MGQGYCGFEKAGLTLKGAGVREGHTIAGTNGLVNKWADFIAGSSKNEESE
jgi:hypothetical protein